MLLYAPHSAQSSRRFLKLFIELTETTVLGRPFQMFTTRWLKKLDRVYMAPLECHIELVTTEVVLTSITFKNSSIFTLSLPVTILKVSIKAPQVHVRLCCRPSIRPSVCLSVCLSVTLMHTTQSRTAWRCFRGVPSAAV